MQKCEIFHEIWWFHCEAKANIGTLKVVKKNRSILYFQQLLGIFKQNTCFLLAENISGLTVYVLFRERKKSQQKSLHVSTRQNKIKISGDLLFSLAF